MERQPVYRKSTGGSGSRMTFVSPRFYSSSYKMAKILKVEGYTAFKAAVKENDGKTLYALFSGSLDDAGKSWCPDCVSADPVIEDSLSKLPPDSVFIKCSVGDRTYWKDQKNDFRTDQDLRIKSVPTLLKLGESQRLEEGQCAKSDLVEMVFTED